jgi:TolB-like protein
MKTTLSIIGLSLLLAGCASMQNWQRFQEANKGQTMPLAAAPAPAATTAMMTPEGQLITTTAPSFVTPANYNGAAYQATRQSAMVSAPQYQPQSMLNVNQYVQGMMHDLVANLDDVKPQMIVGVTSFVYLDGSYDQADLLGNQLSEGFMHEVHQFGLNVVDFKTTDYIRVTPKGDFVFSRDFMELREEQPIEFVLGGTLVQHQGGTLVNVRLVSVASKKVLATAQGFIPEPVVNALQDSASPGKLMLKQGE